MSRRVLVVGAGISGATIARQLKDNGDVPVVIDARSHIAGNCYDRVDDVTGIRVNMYGAHLFHTDSERVWQYVNRFSRWTRWDHQVVASVDNRLVPVPVNINTVNALCNVNIRSEGEMQDWLQANQVKFDSAPKNGQEMAQSLVGQVLYEKIFESYTRKQWNKDPSELDASVLARIPVRANFDNRYFADRHQALPNDGYTSFVAAMLDGIETRLETNFFDMDTSGFDIIVFTGPIDKYFKNKGLPQLEYRSINFTTTILKNTNFFQSNSVVNYPDINTPYTRIVEYKHFLHQRSAHTIIVAETSADASDDMEPYYPVCNEQNRVLYEQYRRLASSEPNVHFVGRLANYKYFNMDQAILNALEYYDTHLA